jgi:hypothetical protein
VAPTGRGPATSGERGLSFRSAAAGTSMRRGLTPLATCGCSSREVLHRTRCSRWHVLAGRRVQALDPGVV